MLVGVVGQVDIFAGQNADSAIAFDRWEFLQKYVDEFWRENAVDWLKVCLRLKAGLAWLLLKRRQCFALLGLECSEAEAAMQQRILACIRA